MPGKNPSLAQHLQRLDSAHIARQARGEKPLSIPQTAAKMIATMQRNAGGTAPRPAPAKAVKLYNKLKP